MIMTTLDLQINKQVIVVTCESREVKDETENREDTEIDEKRLKNS